MSSSHKDIPEYDENVVCDNPECRHLEAPAITGLYGIAGGGGIGVYSVCEHCGTVLTKSLDPEMCETHKYEMKEVGLKTEIKDGQQDADDAEDFANNQESRPDKHE